jgi:SNF2 family DNA or RNA helicase
VEARVRRVMSALNMAHSGPRGSQELRIHESALHALSILTEEDTAFEWDSAARLWLDRVEQLKTTDVKVPAALRAELRPYQVEGFHFLYRMTELGLGACLADDMGLGKTVQILAVLLERISRGPVLVVAPTSVCSNWMIEIQRFAPSLPAYEFTGQERMSLLANLGAEGSPHPVIICSYALLQQDSEHLCKVEWGSVVLDEAQFIKNPTSRRALAAYKLKAQYRIAATGTPVENHLGDLWSIFHFLNPELFGTWRGFDRAFVKPIERDADAEKQALLRKHVQPYILRRLKSQVLPDLPPITTIRHEVRLSESEALRYALLRRQIHEKLSTTYGRRQHKLEILAEIMRLRRFCCHPKLVFPDADYDASKVETFLQLVEELRQSDHRALVFSQFVDFLGLVRDRLDEQGIPYTYLDGSTPKRDRQARVEAFQAGETPLFLISLKAGGFGLNLTAADYVIHLDPWWNPAVEAQATDRAHRIGQDRPVTVYRLITKNTIEERIVQLHEEKRRLADALLEGGDKAGAVDTEDLLALLNQA